MLLLGGSGILIVLTFRFWRTDEFEFLRLKCKFFSPKPNALNYNWYQLLHIPLFFWKATVLLNKSLAAPVSKAWLGGIQFVT